MQIIVNPSEENPKTLLALAVLFNTLAGKAPAADLGNVVSGAEPIPSIPESTDSTSATDAPDTSSTASNQAVSSQSGATDTDKKGLAWDARIHSSSKALNADGTWRYMRGVDKDLIPIVEAELRGAVPPMAPVPDAPAGEDVPPIPDAEEEAAPPIPEVVTAGDVFKFITANKLSNTDTLQQALDTVGIDKMATFMSRSKSEPDLAGDLLDALQMIHG